VADQGAASRDKPSVLNSMKVPHKRDVDPNLQNLGTWSVGHISAAYNLYFHRDNREIAMSAAGRVTVYSVSPDEIRIRCEK